MSVTYTISPVSGDNSAVVFSDSSLKTKIGTLQKGNTISVLGSGSNWYKINYSNGRSSAPTSGKVTANSGLNARTGPGTQYKIVGAFPKGTALAIIKNESGWYNVNGGSLTNVWVSAQYVSSFSTQTDGYVSKSDVKSSNASNTTSSSSSTTVDPDDAIRQRYDTNFNASFKNITDNTSTGYSVGSTKRYLGTDQYYTDLMDTLNYCFGCPPKYNMDIDIQYISKIGLGRVVSQTYYANPTVLSICPGKVKMFPHLFNKSARENAFSQLWGLASGDDSVAQKIMADKESDIFNGTLYEFTQDTEDYGKRVNLLCRACAILLGIGEETVPRTSIKFQNFDYTYWSIRKKYSPNTGKTQNVFTDFWKGGFEAISSGMTDKNYLHFLVSNENTSVSENITTNVESSFLESLFQTTNTLASQLSYFSGVGFNNQMDAKTNVNNILNGIIGENGWTKLVDNVMSGGRLKIPKIVGETDYTQSASCSLTFVSPYGNPKSVFLWCIVPVCHLYALALPKQLSDTMYSYPYVLKVNQKGWFNSNLAVMSNINLTRGGNDGTSWSSRGLATEWTVNFEISPLYSQLTMPSTDHPLLFMRNDGLIDFLGNLCGFDLKANNFDVKLQLLTSFITNRFTGIPNDIQRWFSDSVSGVLDKVFHIG